MKGGISSSAWIDDLDGGGLRVTIPESFTDAEFDAEFDAFSERLRGARPGLKLMIVVLMKSRSRPQNRERAKRFFQEEKLLLKERVCAGALVSENVAIRGAIRGVSLLGLFPFPVKTFSAVSEAQCWLKSRS